MKLNNKGFTLVELLAVVVLLSILIAITIPSVNYLIDKSKEDNYNSLKKNIISAAKVYLSDNRYNVTLDYADNGGVCSGSEIDEDIASIADTDLSSLMGVSKLPIKVLIDNKNISTNSSGNIENPRNKEEILDLEKSYILVKYQCNNKDYSYILEDEYLFWK